MLHASNSNQMSPLSRMFLLLLIAIPITILSSTMGEQYLYIHSEEFYPKEVLPLVSNDLPNEISDDLRSTVEETMRGFTGGFILNPETSSKIKYLLKSPSMSVGFTTSAIRMRIPTFEPSDSLEVKEYTRLENDLDESPIKDTKIVGYTPVAIEFLGSNSVDPVVESPSKAYYSYFRGNDSSEWLTNQPYYQKLIFPNIYNGIDLIYQLKEGMLKYEFLVHPGGDYHNIKIHWTGPVTVKQSEEGLKIVINTPQGKVSLMDSHPINYQGSQRDELISGNFRLINDNTYAFEIANHDPRKLLIIDPIIEINPLGMSTFIGGSGSDYGNSIAVDDSDNVYVTGYTIGGDPDFPTTFNAYNQTNNGGSDVFVTKLAANGSILLFSTYIGGSGDDRAYSLVLDSENNVYLTGQTSGGGPAYPTTSNAFNQTHSGGSDVFVTKLAANGSTLLFSTFLGGSGADYGRSIVIDDANNVYVTGQTRNGTSNFPTTNGAFYETHNGQDDVFVTKLAANGSTLLFSTFLGGSGYDRAFSIAVDNSENVYVAGYTIDGTTDYPTTSNAYDQTHNGVYDAFVTKLAANGSILLFSTFLGGSGLDCAYSIAVDNSENVYVAGYTIDDTTDYPTTSNAYDQTHNGASDVFVTKLAANGSTLLFSTYIGGSGDDYGQSIVVDSENNTYLTGYTDEDTLDYPTTDNAYDRSYNGGDDVFVTKLAANGSILLFSTFIGSSEHDKGYSLALDSTNSVYLTGSTVYPQTGVDFPTTVNAFNQTHNGNYDVFVTHLLVPRIPDAPTNVIASLTNASVLLTWDAPFNGHDPSFWYKIYRGSSSGGTYSLIGTSENENFNDTTISDGQTYYYVVAAVNYLGTSDNSSETTITVPSLPASPENVQVSAGDHYIYLEWDIPVSDGGSAIIEYHIKRGISSTNYDLTFVANTTEFNDTSVSVNTTYYYTICAVNDIGESPLSAEVSTAPTATIPGVPQSLTATTGDL